MITITLEILVAIVVPLIVLLFSTGVATASVRIQLKSQDRKMDLMLQKQDITNGTVLKNSQGIMRQEFINQSTDARLVKLEQK